MPKIVITGGAGFIGANAAAHYAGRGWRVVVVDNFSRAGTRWNAEGLRGAGDVEIVEEDVRRREAIASLVERHRDAAAVLHLAGQVAVTASVADPVTDFEINVAGTVNVLEAVRHAGGRPVVLYSSTNKVYGQLADERLREGATRWTAVTRAGGVAETQPLDFHSPYGCSKGAAEMYVRDYARIYGLRTVSLRQSCIYGPRQVGMEDQGWLAWFVIRAVLGRPVTIFGDGKQVRDVLFVDDLLDCYDRCIAAADRISGESFNIGGGPDASLSLLELVALLRERHGLDLRCTFSEARPGDQRVYVSDVSRACASLGWKPTVTPVDGVGALVEWVRNHRGLFESLPVSPAR